MAPGVPEERLQRRQRPSRPQGLEGFCCDALEALQSRAGGEGCACTARLDHHESDERDHREREREAACEVVVSRVGSLAGRSRLRGLGRGEPRGGGVADGGPRGVAHVRARERAGTYPPAARARERRVIRVGNTRGVREGDARRRRGSPRFRRCLKRGDRGPVPKGASRPPARRAKHRRRDADRDHPPHRGDARRTGVCVCDARRRERGREPDRVSETSREPAKRNIFYSHHTRRARRVDDSSKTKSPRAALEHIFAGLSIYTPGG